MCVCMGTSNKLLAASSTDFHIVRGWLQLTKNNIIIDLLEDYRQLESTKQTL